MNNPFDELTKNLAQSVTRRAALKKFGVGLAGLTLACFGLANKAQATNPANKFNNCVRKCLRQHPTWTVYQCQNSCITISGGF